jgi:hypothetical protein
MNAKLTLTMEPLVIAQAKEYARQQKRSLSDLIENYLKFIVKDTPVPEKEIEVSPWIQSLRGSVKVPKDFDYDYKRIIGEIRTEKYLKYLNNDETVN